MSALYSVRDRHSTVFKGSDGVDLVKANARPRYADALLKHGVRRVSRSEEWDRTLKFCTMAVYL
jgi:hypothetical protein